MLLFQLSYYSHYAYFALRSSHASLTHDIVVGAVDIAIALSLRRSRAPLLHYFGLTVLLAVTWWDRSGYSIN